jgi:hypothetical protein
MADFLSLLTSIPSLMANFSGSTSNPYGREQEALARRMSEISAAQTDVNNPLYKQLYGQYQDQNRQSLAQTVAELQGQNRMNTRNGRTPLFSPDRGGEAIFRNLMQGYQGLGNQADAQTRQALSAAMGGAASTGSLYNAISPNAAEASKKKLAGFGSIFDILDEQRKSKTPVAASSSPAPAMFAQASQFNQDPTSEALKKLLSSQPSYGVSSLFSGNRGY